MGSLQTVGMLWLVLKRFSRLVRVQPIPDIGIPHLAQRQEVGRRYRGRRGRLGGVTGSLTTTWVQVATHHPRDSSWAIDSRRAENFERAAFQKLKLRRVIQPCTVATPRPTSSTGTHSHSHTRINSPLSSECPKRPRSIDMAALGAPRIRRAAQNIQFTYARTATTGAEPLEDRC